MSTNAWRTTELGKTVKEVGKNFSTVYFVVVKKSGEDPMTKTSSSQQMKVSTPTKSSSRAENVVSAIKKMAFIVSPATPWFVIAKGPTSAAEEPKREPPTVDEIKGAGDAPMATLNKLSQ
jgi:hypothetical protein